MLSKTVERIETDFKPKLYYCRFCFFVFCFRLSLINLFAGKLKPYTLCFPIRGDHFAWWTQRFSKDQLLKPPTSSHYQQTFYISLKLLSGNAEQYSFFKNHVKYPKLSVFNVFKICIYNFMGMINQYQFLCWKCGHISWNNNQNYLQ